MMQGAVVTLDRETVDRLSAGLQGDLITPDDAGYDDARTLYNAMIDKHPALIVRCAHAADVAGIALFLQPMQDLTVEDRISRTQYQYTLEDTDPEELNRWAPVFVDALQARPELRDVSSDQQDRGLQTSLIIDRATASRLGITPRMIDTVLNDAFGQRQVSTIFTSSDAYSVILQAAEADLVLVMRNQALDGIAQRYDQTHARVVAMDAGRRIAAR